MLLILSLWTSFDPIPDCVDTINIDDDGLQVWAIGYNIKANYEIEEIHQRYKVDVGPC